MRRCTFRPRKRTWGGLWFLGAMAIVGSAAISSGASAGDPDERLPKEFQKSPYNLMSLSVGKPNDGWQIRAKRLKKTPHVRILEKSKDRVYGHPALVLMLKRTAKQVASASPGATMVVADLSDKDGGPLSGHRSHQSGRDGDILFYAKNAQGKSVILDRFVAFDGNGKAKDGSGLVFDDGRNWLLVQAMVMDDRAVLQHIFVSSPLRRRLLDYASKHNLHKKHVDKVAPLLKQPADSNAHDDHFHVRIKCPQKQEGLCKG